MKSGPLKILDPNLYRRGQSITAVSRWASVGVSLVAFALVWHSPRTRPGPCLAVGTGYILFNLASQLWMRRHPRSRTLKVAHDVVDALAVGLGAVFSGALASPIWLLLYTHVVAVSVRGGLAYAMSMGVLDAVIVTALAYLTPDQPLGSLHALALLFCAFMGGTTSSYLHEIQGRLYAANKELSSKNTQLSETLDAQEASRREQELAMARLRDSEERYRRLLERIQDGVLIVQDGRVVYANQVFADMMGEIPAGLVGADFRDLVPPEDRKDVAERYRNWETSRQTSGGFESRVRTRKGETLLVSLRAGSVEFEGKRSIVTTIRDITRERRMEQEVKAHAERLAAINEIANAVNLSLTIEDIFRVAAEETRRLVPFERLTIALLDEEGPGVEVVAVGAGAQRQRAPFDRDEIAWALRRPMAWCQGGEEPPPHLVQGLLAEAGMRAIATVPLLTKERVIGSLNLGRRKPVAFSAWDLGVMEPVARHIAIALDNARLLEAVRKRSQEFESLLEIGRGIVERLELEELLPLVTRSVNRVMGTQHCLLLLRDGDRLRVAAQEGFEVEVVEALGNIRVGESLSGWVAREGRPIAVLEIRDDPRARFVDIANGYGYRSLLCVPLKHGTETVGTLEVVTKEPRRFGPEQQQLMAAFAAEAAVAIENARLFRQARTHLSEMAEANRRLEELDQLRRQYLRNVSHEFRTPLTVIKGYAEYLADGGASDARALGDVMRVMVESCDRVIDMVDTLIEVSRIEQGAGQDSLQIQSLDLREVTSTTVEALKPFADKKGIALATELPSEPLGLQGDAGLLQQLVRKLVDNALKYSPAGAQVVVRAARDGDDLALEVEDSGIGIAPEHLGRIFEKFYMVDGGIARRVGGTGVGLYLVREIVRLHNGRVDVRSRPGHGSVFSVRLPRLFRGDHPQTAIA